MITTRDLRSAMVVICHKGIENRDGGKLVVLRCAEGVPSLMVTLANLPKFPLFGG